MADLQIFERTDTRNKIKKQGGMKMNYAKTVIFDFDGVIHSYDSGWLGADIIPDEPVPGIKEAIDEIRAAGYRVVVLSARCHQGGIKAIKNFLNENEIIVDDVVRDKVPAILQVDDRAICFDGKPEKLLEKIQGFQPWNKKEF